MTRRRRTRVAAALTALAALAVFATSGCGNQLDSAQGGGGAGGKSAPLFDKLPKKVQQAGVIKVGTDAAYKPMEYKEGPEIVGLDPDIAEAISEKLGVRVEFTNGTFDGLLTSLRTGRFDMVMSSMSDTKERQLGLDDSGKKAGEGVDFVDYLRAGSSILVRRGNPDDITSVSQMCGESVATQRGTVSHDILKTQTKKCRASGKSAINVEAYNNDDEARLRLQTGAVVADVADSPVADYAAVNGPGFQVVGPQMQSAPYGMAVLKSNTELRDALHAALDLIIEDGSYQRALDKWGIQKGGVSKAKINSGS